MLLCWKANVVIADLSIYESGNLDASIGKQPNTTFSTIEYTRVQGDPPSKTVYVLYGTGFRYWIIRRSSYQVQRLFSKCCILLPHEEMYYIWNHFFYLLHKLYSVLLPSSILPSIYFLSINRVKYGQKIKMRI